MVNNVAEEALARLIEAVNSGNLIAASACFTREGCLVTPDGTAVHGRSDIAAILAQMIASRTELSVEQIAIRHGGDVALATGRLTIGADGPGRERVDQACAPTAVLRRVEEVWKIAILAPWAAA